MPDSDFLSQEEIDTLLEGEINNDETQEDSSEEVSLEIKPFDFSELESIKKGGLAGLDIIFDRWAKTFREEIRKILPKINMVSKESIYLSRFNSFMNKIPMPSTYTIFTMRPLKESALLVVDSRLVFTIISVMFGGPAKPFKVEGREFTKLETYIIKDFIDYALKTLEKTFKMIIDVEVEKKSIEHNPSLARITNSNEKVVVVECNIDIDGFEAPIYFCFPQGMFLPIKNKIYSEFTGEIDKNWLDRLNELINTTPVEVTLELDKKVYLMRDVLGWKEGTKIILDKTKDDFAVLKVENQEKFNCKLGKVKNKYAALLKEEVVKKEEEIESATTDESARTDDKSDGEAGDESS